MAETITRAIPEVGLIPTTVEHVRYLAGRVRVEEFLQTGQVFGQTPEEAALASLATSRMTYTLTLCGVPVACGGVSPHPDMAELGMPWMLVSEEATHHRKDLLGATCAAMLDVPDHFPAGMVTVIDSRFVKAIRWAEHLGFDISEETTEVGPMKVPVRVAIWRR